MILLPAVTGLGVPLLVTDRSQTVATGVVMVVLLLAELGSLVVEETEEVAEIEATTTDDATFTTTMISADAPAARLGSTQDTLPVPPTGGVVHDQPAGTEMEAKVVLAGTASSKVAATAAAGPLLVTV